MRVLDFTTLCSPNMESLSQLHHPRPPASVPLVFSKPLSSEFPIRPQYLSLKLLRAKASSFSSTPCSSHHSPEPHFPKTLTLISSSSSFVRNSCIAITAAAFFLASLTHRALPAVASPLARAPPMVESQTVEHGVYDAEKERSLERYVASNPDDVKALQTLLECKVRGQKFEEAIVILERLSLLQPDNTEWVLLRANLYSVSGETELAKNCFEEVLKKDPICVEAYHGIVTALSQSEAPSSAEELTGMFKRVEVAMESCKKDDARDFKLLLGQIKVFEGNFGDALKMYQQLAAEEPRDHMPYLCQGIVYKLLSRDKEAEIQFEKYKKLAPKDHPYTQYLEDNMFGSLAKSAKEADDLS